MAVLPETIVAFDVETTGLDAEDRIVSFGAVALRTREIEGGPAALRSLHLVFDPGRPSHPRARAVHGYADAVLRVQDRFADHAEAIGSFLSAGDLLVAHNAAFDGGFVAREMSLAGKPPPHRPVFCTMDYHRRTGIGSASLDACCRALGIARRGTLHGALEDAWLALAIFMAQHGRPVPAALAHGLDLRPINLREGPAVTDGDANGVLGHVLGPRREPILRPAPGVGRHGPAEDVQESSEEEESIDLDGLALGLRYRDASGAVSERTIRCTVARRDAGTLYLDAWCELRRSARSFRLDRILAVTDYTTGVVYDDVASFFRDYLPPDWLSLLGTRKPSAGKTTAVESPPAARSLRGPGAEARPEPIPPLALHGARVLMYLAMEDGALHANELEHVVDHMMATWGRLGVVDAGARDRAALWARNYVPSRRAALIALGKVLADSAAAGDLGHRVVDLIVADGAATDGEMAAAWGIVEAMRRAETRTRA